MGPRGALPTGGGRLGACAQASLDAGRGHSPCPPCFRAGTPTLSGTFQRSSFRTASRAVMVLTRVLWPPESTATKEPLALSGGTDPQPQRPQPCSGFKGHRRGLVPSLLTPRLTGCAQEGAACVPAVSSRSTSTPRNPVDRPPRQWPLPSSRHAGRCCPAGPQSALNVAWPWPGPGWRESRVAVFRVTAGSVCLSDCPPALFGLSPCRRRGAWGPWGGGGESGPCGCLS